MYVGDDDGLSGMCCDECAEAQLSGMGLTQIPLDQAPMRDCASGVMCQDFSECYDMTTGSVMQASCAQPLNFVPPASSSPAASSSCTGLPIADFLLCEANKILAPRPPSTPVYTPPYLPTYPVNTNTPAAPAPSMFSQTPNWLPWAAGALAVAYIASRR